MGTISFDAKFKGMRNPQDFIVYPLESAAASIKIQSDTRMGRINLETGVVEMSPPRAGGSYFIHLSQAKDVATLSGEELLLLKTQVCASASQHAGTNGILYTDNKGAAGVFGDLSATTPMPV